ncbi:cupin-like domain-containing protein [Congregibacter litoralis]|nr:cupin-like domain-containing protein [Congregibacter litoralis]
MSLDLKSTPYLDGSPLKQAIARREPLVLTDLAASWPALKKWTPDQLTALYGNRPVRVYDASFGTPGRNYMGSIDTMSFAEFLEETLHGGRDLRMFLYNLSQQIPQLLDDIVLPEVGLKFSRQFVFSFFGCKGSTTPLHYDIDMGDVLHAVVRGRRRIRLFAPEDSVWLHRHPFTVRSYLDLDGPTSALPPSLSRARCFEVILEPGQTLYMPAGWWHEFHYLEAGIGVSLRAASPHWRERIKGWGNLLVVSPIDRLANKVAPQRWYSWKRTHAEALAQAASQVKSA